MLPKRNQQRLKLDTGNTQSDRDEGASPKGVFFQLWCRFADSNGETGPGSLWPKGLNEGRR